VRLKKVSETNAREGGRQKYKLADSMWTPPNSPR
jgi:hypothetical protein